MKFNELFVGDTFNFASNSTLAGTYFISCYTDELAGDIKVLMSSETSKCYHIMESDKLKIHDMYIEVPNDEEVELLTRSLEENPYNGISYLGNKIVYSSEKDNLIITRRSDILKYDVYVYLIHTKTFKTFEDCLKYTNILN